MKALALMALGAVGVWWLTLAEKKYAGRVAMDPGVVGDEEYAPVGASRLMRVGEVWTYADIGTEVWDA